MSCGSQHSQVALAIFWAYAKESSTSKFSAIFLIFLAVWIRFWFFGKKSANRPHHSGYFLFRSGFFLIRSCSWRIIWKLVRFIFLVLMRLLSTSDQKFLDKESFNCNKVICAFSLHLETFGKNNFWSYSVYAIGYLAEVQLSYRPSVLCWNKF